MGGQLTSISIVIVSYNTRDDLARCLDALLATPPAATHEIVVIDNGSTDGSVDVVRARPGVRLIDSGRNIGFARANNIGIRATQCVNVLALNSDTIVPPGAIDRLLAELDANPDVAVVGPRIVDGQGRAELSFGRMMSPFNEFRQKRLGRGPVDALTRQRGYPDWVSAACLLVRRADAESVGLFDERYFMYTEDVDFCAAIRARGRKILFAPDIEIVHLRGRSAATAPRETNAAYRRSHLAFYDKHHPVWAPLLRLYLWLRGEWAGKAGKAGKAG